MILETIGIIILLMLIGFLSFQLVFRRLKKLKEHMIIEILKKHGKVVLEGHNITFYFHDEVIKIYLFYVPMQSELTINSKTMWEVKMMHKSELINQTKLAQDPSLKWVIIYPSTQPIKRYINENELEFVKPDQRFYNMQVIALNALESYLEQ